MRATLTLLAFFVASVAHAQEVRKVPDVLSWGTAAVNPAVAAVAAWRSPDRGCRLLRLALSEGVGNGLTLALKHTIRGERPCAGCAPDGFPSGHTMNSTIGFSSRWGIGLSFTLGTADLRVAARRHTAWQVAAGAAIGIGAEAMGRLVRCS